MNARKRKAPERKKSVAKEPGLLWRAVTGFCSLIGRQPRRIAGLLCVCVGCSFVAANALWYQPENHPAPFLRTRDIHDPNAIAGFRPLQRQTDDAVTTFRIERARSGDDVRNLIASDGQPPPPPAATVPQAANVAVAAPAAETVESLIAHAGEPAAQTAPVADVTAAAPPPLPAQVAVPRQRPAGKLDGEDPVAAAIRTAQQSAAPKPPADIPAISKANKAAQAMPQPTRISTTQTAAQAVPPTTPPATVSDNMTMIMQIQRGLVNIAYTDVTVDGVAGAQTRAAIRHFQKHYRLPENGEPSELVLRKLKSIGAL